MKRNIIITGFDLKLSDKVAKDVADRLSMFYLSFADLALYHANRKTAEEVYEEGGSALYQKFFSMAVNDALEYDNMVGSVDFLDINGHQLDALKETALVVFLGKPVSSLKNNGILCLDDSANYSRYRYKNSYDIYVNADKTRAKELEKIILDRIYLYFGGDDGKV